MGRALTLLAQANFLGRLAAIRTALPGISFLVLGGSLTGASPAGQAANAGGGIGLLPKAFSGISETALLGAILLMASAILPMLILRRLGRSSSDVFVLQPRRGVSPIWALSAKGLALLVGGVTILNFGLWGATGWFRGFWNPENLAEEPYTGAAILAASIALWVNAHEAIASEAAWQTGPANSAQQLGGVGEWRRQHRVWNGLRLLCGAAPAVAGAVFFAAWLTTATTSAAAKQAGARPLAVSLALFPLGLALLTSGKQRLTKFAQVMALLVSALSLLSVNDCLLRRGAVEGIALEANMGLPVSLSLLLLSFGILSCSASKGLMQTLSAAGLGGEFARWMIPFALLTPTALKWIELNMQFAGLYDRFFGISLFLAMLEISVAALIWKGTAIFNRLNSLRNRMQADLKHNIELYRTTIETIPQIVLTTGADGKLEFASKRWQQYTGLAEDGSRSLEKLVHPDDLPRMRETWRSCLPASQPFHGEYRIGNAAGEYRWFLVQAVPVFGTEGQIERWFFTLSDVEDYKRAEAEIRTLTDALEAKVAARTAELRESRERIQAMIGGVRDYAISALDANGHVTSWNAGSVEQFGYSEEEALGQHFSIFYPPEQREIGMAEIDLEAARRYGETRTEGWRQGKNGKEFWCSTLITSITNEFFVLKGFCQIARDISERKYAEELVNQQSAELAQLNEELFLQKQRAQDAARAKSEFLAAMSHEIRTPMNAILAMADVLWQTNLDQDQKEMVEIFRRNGRVLLMLINDILDFSKIEAGQLELEALTFNLHQLMRHTSKLAETSAKNKGLTFSLTIAPDVPRYVVGDSTRLQQIIVNLLNNAVKFTLTGGITLAVRQVEDDPASFYFSVSDTGIGIAPDKLDHIFEKFTQADSSTTRKFGGTGLGLSISRSLAKLMGGRLWVTSVLGEGSTFHFTVKLGAALGDALPEEEETDSRRSATEALEGRSAGPLRLLVAEDAADNRRVIEIYLKGLPVTVTFAEDGQEAIKLFSSGTYDLVLMDLQMPVLDGISATRAIRALEAQRGVAATPIVALSADAGEKDKARCMEAGCNDHCAKPIALERFLGLLSKYGQPSTKDAVVAKGSNAGAVSAGLKKLVPAYLAKRRQDYEKIVSFRAAGDFDQIRSLAHQMKGSGRTYGFPDLSNLAAALEAAAEGRDGELVERHTEELQAFIEKTVVEVKEGG